MCASWSKLLGMETTYWAVILKPIFLFLLVALVLYPIRRAVMRWFPEGKVKRLLLWRTN